MTDTASSVTRTTKADWTSDQEPRWCPGCGDYSVLTAMQLMLPDLEGSRPEDTVFISGIGCAARFPYHMNTYGMHTLHGRSLAVATGMQMANHKLKVIATGGDGDGYGIGGNHFLHTMRRNVDITYIVMDNQIYGLTTGQTSPTSVLGMKTKSTPHGNVENPINPMPLAMVGGATYVARGFSGKQKHLIDLMKGAIMHRGFSLIDVFSPCVTYNLDNTYKWFTPRIKILDDEEGYDPTDFHAAIDKAYQWGDEIPIGLIWKRETLPALDETELVLQDGGPLAYRKLGVTKEQSDALISELL